MFRLIPFAVFVLVLALLMMDCAGARAKSYASEKEDLATRVARRGLKMLLPENRFYNPERGRAYLEYGLKHGAVKALEVPSSVLLELLRGERLARKKNEVLERKLATMKEIDLDREEMEEQSGRNNLN